MRIWTASDVVEILGIPYHRLIYWEATRKIPRARRTENDKRFYTDEDLVGLRQAIEAMHWKDSHASGE